MKPHQLICILSGSLLPILPMIKVEMFLRKFVSPSEILNVNLCVVGGLRQDAKSEMDEHHKNRNRVD